MQGRAIVIGGSIGGLFAASMLRLKGWDVDVSERTPVELIGRGAGIVTHQTLLNALELCGAGIKDLGIEVQYRTAYDLEGRVIRQIELPQLVTSWDRLLTLTRATIPDDRHHLGHVLDRFEDTGDGVRAHFANGHVAEADLLVGADGFRSAVRGQLFRKCNQNTRATSFGVVSPMNATCR
jgi:2-polyprenyl-6-methoxyphenol hydroxylase-like FAD-dependent oxidoreductase